MIGGEIFWGNDATAMAVDWLDDPAAFSHGEYARIATLPQAIQRAR